MRRVVVLALLALALPMAATADIIMMNQGGTIAISNMLGTGGLGTIGASTISSKGSQLTQFNGYTGHLGYVNYSTGTLASGSVSGGGTFSAGGTFDIFGVGAWAKTVTGCPSCKNPISLFTGSFSGPVTWTLDSAGKNESTFTLSGIITGTLWNGRLVTGYTSQNIAILTKGQLNNGVGHISMGTTGITTPEPGTLGLLGTGLVAVAGMFRRKLIRG